MPKPSTTKPHTLEIVRLHAMKWSDKAIANALGLSYSAVRDYRLYQLRLPAWPRNELLHRAKGRRSQERSLGCGPQDVRADQLWSYAINLGWPAGLRKRAAQILELLIDVGPLTRQQIAERLLLTLKRLNSNDPQGTYLSNLISRGLVASVARAVDTGRVCRDGRTRKGTQVSLYFPTPEAIAMKLAWRRTHSSQDTHS